FSGGLPYFLTKASVNFCADGDFTCESHTSGQIPVTLPLPAPQATAVSKPKPATGYGNPNSMYCFMKLVICAPARFDTTRSGFAVEHVAVARFAAKLV